MANKATPAGRPVSKAAPGIQADCGHLQAQVTRTEVVNWCHVSPATAFLTNYE